ncbi:MAG: ribonuclease III [Pseudomonadota bacterium]
MDFDDFKGLENELKYDFEDMSLLKKALTHKSYKNEKKNTEFQDNQRLEFLGDSVLSLAISEHLFKNYMDKNEGWLSKVRSLFVKEDTLFKISEKIRVGDYILLGKGEEATGGRKKPSVLADALEAIIGAIYLDSSLKKAISIVHKLFSDVFDVVGKEGFHPDIMTDYKTVLQEVVQKFVKEAPKYQLLEEIGPDHAKVFKSEVLIEEKRYGVGEGKSKKESEQSAAQEALQKYQAVHKNEDDKEFE